MRYVCVPFEGKLGLREKNPHQKYRHDKPTNSFTNEWYNFELTVKIYPYLGNDLKVGDEVDGSEVELVDQYFDPYTDQWEDIWGGKLIQCMKGYDTRQAYRRKQATELPKLSSKISHINCNPEALSDPEFINAMNTMVELAFNKDTKPVQPKELTEEEKQLITFRVSEELEKVFDIKYSGGDNLVYAYEIESTLSSILRKLKLEIRAIQ